MHKDTYHHGFDWYSKNKLKKDGTPKKLNDGAIALRETTKAGTLDDFLIDQYHKRKHFELQQEDSYNNVFSLG